MAKTKTKEQEMEESDSEDFIEASKSYMRFLHDVCGGRRAALLVIADQGKREGVKVSVTEVGAKYLMPCLIEALLKSEDAKDKDDRYVLSTIADILTDKQDDEDE